MSVQVYEGTGDDPRERAENAHALKVLRFTPDIDHWGTSVSVRDEGAQSLIQESGPPVERYPLWHPLGQLDWVFCRGDLNLTGTSLPVLDHPRKLLWGYYGFPYNLTNDKLAEIATIGDAITEHALPCHIGMHGSTLYGPGTFMVYCTVADDTIKAINNWSDDELFEVIRQSCTDAFGQYSEHTECTHLVPFSRIAPDIVGMDGDNALGITDHVKHLIPRVQAWYDRENAQLFNYKGYFRDP